MVQDINEVEWDEYDGWINEERFTFSSEEELEKCKNSQINMGNPGQTCIICKDFFEYAESNQTNGTFKCWNCRQRP